MDNESFYELIRLFTRVYDDCLNQREDSEEKSNYLLKIITQIKDELNLADTLIKDLLDFLQAKGLIVEFKNFQQNILTQKIEELKNKDKEEPLGPRDLYEFNEQLYRDDFTVDKFLEETEEDNGNE